MADTKQTGRPEVNLLAAQAEKEASKQQYADIHRLLTDISAKVDKLIQQQARTKS